VSLKTHPLFYFYVFNVFVGREQKKISFLKNKIFFKKIPSSLIDGFRWIII